MTAEPSGKPSLHGTCVVLGESGILITGPSGAGKSTLALELVERVLGRGGFAALVADDRVVVRAVNGRAVASPVPTIAGLLEMRGYGVVRVPFEPMAVLRLLIELAGGDARGPRLPDAAELMADVEGIRLPMLRCSTDSAATRILRRIRGSGDTLVTE